MKTIEIQCPSCGATGLYVGAAERDGAAVVCARCRGTGKTTYHYEPFSRRKRRDGVRRVLQANPGIVVGAGAQLALEDFGGMPVNDWAEGRPFPAKSEMRKFTCPAWWYQTAAHDLMPKWEECRNPGSRFDCCEHFGDKAKCWERFDQEQAAEAHA